MYSSTRIHRAIARHHTALRQIAAMLHRRNRRSRERSIVHAAIVMPLLAISLTLTAPTELSAQGRTITQFPYSQSFAFIPSGSSTTPNGPIGAAIFPTTDVDGGELIADSNTSALMSSGSATGLNNNLGAGGVIRIQTSGSTMPTMAQGFIVHCSFSARIAGSISIDWTKVTNGTSTRASELRIAASADNGAFTDIAAATFNNSTTAQSGTLSTTLPTTLTGVDSVRFRVYSINVSGSGAHPRVVVDNLQISAEEETPLPVELSSFEASYRDGIVGLVWRTASEHDNDGFEVLRASSADSVFTTLASFRTHVELRGLGTSQSGRTYHFVDELTPSTLTAGVPLLYRLADISPDGTRTMHAIRAVRIEGDNPSSPGLSLVRFRLEEPRPLPADSRLVVRMSLAGDEHVSIEIVGAVGERWRVIESEHLVAGSHERSIDVSELASGAYMLVARAGATVRTQTFVVVR